MWYFNFKNLTPRSKSQVRKNCMGLEYYSPLVAFPVKANSLGKEEIVFFQRVNHAEQLEKQLENSREVTREE